MKKVKNKKSSEVKIFMIAGEQSGDILGGKLISSIKKQIGKNVKINLSGIGGEKMAAEGLKSIFPMSDLSLFGLAEILPHIPKILKRINQTVEEIRQFQPDILITIDAPDFCFRVMKKVNKLKTGKEIKKVHMIAPSVWAHREGRAKTIAKLYDLLLTILPFEPPYFEKYGLESKFIGHPIVENEVDESKLLSKSEFYKKYKIPVKNDLICLTPGSRIGEINRLLPIFLDSVDILRKKNKNLSAAVATTERMKVFVERKIEEYKSAGCCNENVRNLNISVVNNYDDKNSLYRISKVAIAKSGTNTFELMMAKLPMVVCYKFNWLTGKIGRTIIKVKYCNLINIILNKCLIPELVQEYCTPELIAWEVENLLSDKEFAKQQITETQKVLKILGRGNKEKSSDLGAKFILKLI
jgi:lipid-A-disaccharide synthase